jgi:hypothetical protein
MKRFIALLLTAGLFAALLAVPSGASAIVPPTPADGARVALYTWGAAVYEWPTGEWYFDGAVANYSGDNYTAGVAVVDPKVTIEYLNASDVSLGTETISAGANVMPPYAGAGLPTGYFRWVHHKLEDMPAGAVLAKTRIKANSLVYDPQANYATAASAATYQPISYSVSPPDGLLGDGRVQFDLTVTNTTSKYVGPVSVWGNEDYGLSTSNAYMLNVYDVTALDPVKAHRLAPGESTVFHLRGLAATPLGQNRYPWNLEAEAEALSDVVGTVRTKTALPIAGAKVSIPGYADVSTSADGTFAVVGVVPGTYMATVSKAGYFDNKRPVSISYEGNATFAATLERMPVASIPSIPRIYGKASAKKGTTLKGTVSPARAARLTLQIERWSRGKYRTYTHCHFNSNSAGAWTYKVKLKKGTYRVRITTPSADYWVSRTSGWRKVVVK